VSQSGAIRTFVAIPLPAPLIEALQRVQQQLQSKLPSALVRWSKPEQLHLTLRFLGDVPIEQIRQLEAALRVACEPTPALRLRLGGIGCFPHIGNPRVIWVGVGGDVEPLRVLQQRIKQYTGGFGVPAEVRDFTPHLTLGRVKKGWPVAPQIRNGIERFRSDALGDWSATEVELIQSQLRPDGACYTKLASIKLGASNPRVEGNRTAEA
jgi:2'-5' RNA ligase